jgi:hypothetical protein
MTTEDTSNSIIARLSKNGLIPSRTDYDIEYGIGTIVLRS